MAEKEGMGMAALGVLQLRVVPVISGVMMLMINKEKPLVLAVPWRRVQLLALLVIYEALYRDKKFGA